MDVGVVLLLLLLVIYFVPTLVAWAREQPTVIQIFLLNLFLGWTLVGWVAALVWSAAPRAKA